MSVISGKQFIGAYSYWLSPFLPSSAISSSTTSNRETIFTDNQRAQERETIGGKESISLNEKRDDEEYYLQQKGSGMRRRVVNKVSDTIN